jgi:hypothetical protein
LEYRGIRLKSTRKAKIVFAAHPDLNQLLNALLPFAEEMLAKHGEFFPFACAMNPDGEISNVEASDGTEHPPSSTLIDILIEGLSANAGSGKIRASGICLDMRLPASSDRAATDAVCCRLEHVSEEPVAVYIPYKISLQDKVLFQQMFATRLKAEIFRK